MTAALHYSATCLGDGHTACPWTHDGPDSDRAAEKRTKATGHGTSTHARVERKP